MFDKTKARWGVGPWGVLAILLAFSLAGMTVVRIKSPLLGLFLPADSPTWVTWTVYLAVVFPTYQVFLLLYGTLLGQHRFFWMKMRRTARFLFGWILPRSR
jgi:hypothetical protein